LKKKIFQEGAKGRKTINYHQLKDARTEGEQKARKLAGRGKGEREEFSDSLHQWTGYHQVYNRRKREAQTNWGGRGEAAVQANEVAWGGARKTHRGHQGGGRGEACGNNSHT